MKELQFLNNDSRFTLTGSRYWNSLNKELIPLANNSDYDYVAEYSFELVEELRSIGFETRNASFSNGKNVFAKQYSDADTIIVCYFKDIQVILKKNVQSYVALQNILTPEFYIKYLWKRYVPISKIQEVLNLLLNGDFNA